MVDGKKKTFKLTVKLAAHQRRLLEAVKSSWCGSARRLLRLSVGVMLQAPLLGIKSLMNSGNAIVIKKAVGR